MTVRELIEALQRQPADALVVRAGPVFLVPVSQVGTRDLVAVPADAQRGERLRPAERWDPPVPRPPVVVIG